MPNKRFDITLPFGSVTIQGKINRDGEGDHGEQVDVPKGQVGAMSAMTDANTGAATLSTGHGIETGHTVDVVWAGGSRINMAASVSGNVVSLEGGSGTALPAVSTAVTVYRRMIITMVVDGDKLVATGAMLDVAGIFTIKNADPAPIGDVDEVPLIATEPWYWIKDTGADNPLAGEVVATIEVVSRVTTGAAAAKFKFGYQIDSVA